MNDRRLDRFCNCGANFRIEQEQESKELRVRCDKCKDRTCMACANDRAALIVENLCRILDGRTYRFMTFTLRHSNTPLVDQIDRLYRSFAVFRRRKSWLDHVKGGAAFLELKTGKGSGLWHPHLHVLCEGTWWDVFEISREWHAVTGDSSIVDISQPASTEKVARYVTKYVTKPIHSSLFATPNLLDEAINALQGRRLCFTFGTWRGLKLEDVPEVLGTWISCGTPEQLRERVEAGDPDALRKYEAFSRAYPLLAACWPIRPPDEMPF